MLALFVSTAFAFDSSHASLQKVLSAYSSGGKVNYAALKAAPADLDAYLKDVAGASVSAMSASEKKAFYINAYNALTIDLIADNWPVSSITGLDGGKVWDTRKFTVAGQSMTLNDIENKQLRTLNDPRIHAAINCASLGCPPLSSKVFLASTLESQLDSQAKAWAAKATVSGATVTVNKIFDWYGDDFTKVYGAAYKDLPGLDGKAEAAVNFLTKYGRADLGAVTSVVFGEYSWAVNEQ